MAFTSTRDKEGGRLGNMRFAFGTYTNTLGSTGGDIDTGLIAVYGFWHEPYGAAVSLNQGAVTETFAADGKAITIVTDANEVGTWYAFGYK